MTEPTDSLLGMKFDDYRIDKPLGHGGMAKVYRALDVRLKRYVALKVIASDLRAHPEYRERFEREAQSIARLEHPNIVRIYRFGEAEGVYYMAMQYVEGADLATLIREYKASGEVMPIGDVVRVVQDIGAALDYAHSRNVLHRDVKSSNIMVDQEGRALLTDFGLALLGDVTTQGEVLGSPHYVSPEQVVSSSNVVPQSDLYSLGVTLFEMLTGELPFSGNGVVDLTMKQLSEQPPPPSRFNTLLPSSVDEVVLRTLQKDPYDRYASGKELANALQLAVAAWQYNEIPKPGPVRRPSLVLLPHKVREQLDASPLPPIPTGMTPTQVGAQDPILAVQAYPDAHANRQVAIVKAGAPKNRWRSALIVAALVFLLGAVGIMALRPSAMEPVPTSTPEPTITLSPTVIPVIISTATQQGTPLTPLPLAPTAVPFTMTALPGAIPTSAIPTAAFPTAIPATLNLPTAALANAVPSYTLTIARRGEDSLFIINTSASDFPLAPLRLGDRGSINGSEWGLDVLGRNQCVTAWKDGGNPEMPNVSCTQVGARIIRDGPNRFWKESFDVYYDGSLVGTCNSESCSITIEGT